MSVLILFLPTNSAVWCLFSLSLEIHKFRSSALWRWVTQNSYFVCPLPYHHLIPNLFIYLFIFGEKKLLFAIGRCFCHYNGFCVVRVPLFYIQDHNILVSGLAFYLLGIYSFHLRFRNIVPFWGWLSLFLRRLRSPAPLTLSPSSWLLKQGCHLLTGFKMLFHRDGDLKTAPIDSDVWMLETQLVEMFWERLESVALLKEVVTGGEFWGFKRPGHFQSALSATCSWIKAQTLSYCSSL